MDGITRQHRIEDIKAWQIRQLAEFECDSPKGLSVSARAAWDQNTAELDGLVADQYDLINDIARSGEDGSHPGYVRTTQSRGHRDSGIRAIERTHDKGTM